MPTAPLSAASGEWNFFTCDSDQEEEANWLAGVLLISEDAALAIVRNGLSFEAAASQYGVSTPMVRFRVNMTGARRRVRGYSG